MKDGKFYDFYRGKDGKIGSPTFHSCICSTPNRSKKGIPIIATILFQQEITEISSQLVSLNSN
jgi:hypothetical protein